MSDRRRKLRMEQMEARQMMAGDVTAVLQGGNLIINEAAGQAGLDNAVSIMRISDNRVRVTGMPTLTDGTVTKINGLPSQEFTIGIPVLNPTGSLIVNLGGGSDSIATAPVGGELKFKDIQIDVSGPPATNTRSGSPALTRADNDLVFLERFQTRGNVSIKTGLGNDSVTVLNGLIGETGKPNANLSINTGAGADTVRVRSTVDINQAVTQITGVVDIQTFSSLTEKDVDNVFLERFQVNDDLRVRTGDGNDVISMDLLFVSHDLEFDAGNGNDTATVKSVTAIDSLMAKMGAGDDTLSTETLFTKKLSLLGDGGFDRLFKKPDLGVTTRVQTGWEQINNLSTTVSGGVTLPAVPVARL